MKQLFAIGQAVTPSKKPNWVITRTSDPKLKAGDSINGPKFGDIVHVSAFKSEDSGYIQFQEYPPVNREPLWFAQKMFSPVVSDSVLSKELEEIFQEDLVESK